MRKAAFCVIIAEDYTHDPYIRLYVVSYVLHNFQQIKYIIILFICYEQQLFALP